MRQTNYQYCSYIRSVFLCLLAIVLFSSTAVHGQRFQQQDRVAIVGGAFADLMHLHGYFETTLRHRCFDKSILVRNFGWAGDTLTDRARPDNFASEDQWLSDYKTDVILICFGMGESFLGDSGLEGFGNELRSLVQHYRNQKYNDVSAPRLIVVSPIAHESIESPMVDVRQRNHDLKNYTAAMKRVSKELEIPFVDLFSPSKALMDEGGGSRLTNNGIQLNAYGYWAISQILVDKLLTANRPLQLVADANGPLQQVKGGIVKQINKTDNELTWNIEPKGWPSVSPPEGSTVHSSLQRFQDQVVINSLPPGSHRLSFTNGKSITASAQQWSNGVVIDSTPRHQQMEIYRQYVNEKNLKYFHGWRALNQVHIVGERKKSPSGRALPAELDEWFRMAAEQDKALSVIAAPSRNELWTLQAVEGVDK